jgi:hypothetical protein
MTVVHSEDGRTISTTSSRADKVAIELVHRFGLGTHPKRVTIRVGNKFVVQPPTSDPQPPKSIPSDVFVYATHGEAPAHMIKYVKAEAEAEAK